MHAPIEAPAKPAKGPLLLLLLLLLALRRSEGRRASGTQNPHIDPTEPGASSIQCSVSAVLGTRD
jgi:MYXO-CTERM domain-containing protein